MTPILSSRAARWLLPAFALLLGPLPVPGPAAATDQAPEQLHVALKKSLLLDLGQPVETVSITDTDLADFVVAANTQVLIHGKKEGTTSLVVWVQGGGHRSYDLVVQRGFAPKQVLLSVQVAEVNKSALTEYGVDYLLRLTGGDKVDAGAYPGGVAKPAIPLAAGSLPEFPDETSLALRWMKSQQDYSVLIHALQQKGLLKVLARPNLLCMNGKEASFLAGGEIPIPVAQTSSAGGTTVTIEWREFGTRLKFVPTVVDSNLINLKVKPEVSSLDFNNAVVIGGYVVPALRTRRAETEVELHEGEHLVLGGLQSTNVRDNRNKLPILGDIPLLGHLFRSVSKTTEETELMIVVSPTIVKAVKAEDLPPMPGSTEPEQGD